MADLKLTIELATMGPTLAAISDGPTGTAIYPTVGSQTSVAIVSADGSTAFGAAVSAFAKSINFKKKKLY